MSWRPQPLTGGQLSFCFNCDRHDFAFYLGPRSNCHHLFNYPNVPLRSSFRFKSSRVRLGLLQCLQAMAKSDSRALHQHWTSLLPLQQPTQQRPTPHLVSMVLNDPVPKVRACGSPQNS